MISGSLAVSIGKACCTESHGIDWDGAMVIDTEQQWKWMLKLGTFGLGCTQ